MADVEETGNVLPLAHDDRLLALPDHRDGIRQHDILRDDMTARQKTDRGAMGRAHGRGNRRLRRIGGVAIVRVIAGH